MIHVLAGDGTSETDTISLKANRNSTNSLTSDQTELWYELQTTVNHTYKFGQYLIDDEQSSSLAAYAVDEDGNSEKIKSSTTYGGIAYFT